MLLPIYHCYREYAGRLVLGCLLLITLILPAQAYAQCNMPVNQQTDVVSANVSTYPEDCKNRDLVACRQLLEALKLAEIQYERLSSNLSTLQSEQVQRRESLSDLGRLLKTKSVGEGRSNVVFALQNATWTSVEIVKIQIAIASVRSELLIANHKRQRADADVKQFKKCMNLL